MAGEIEEFKTPVGRFVQGDCFVANDKDQMGNPRKNQKGELTSSYFVAVAFQKGGAEVEALRAAFDRIARAAFPEFFPNGGPCANPQFSWKIIDGDGFDSNGKPNNQKEGFAGCWVFKFSSQFAPKCYIRPNFAAEQQVQSQDAHKIKRGDYIMVAFTVKSNKGASPKPGLFVNLQLVSWEHTGPAITSGPDAQAVFGQGAPAAAPMAPPPAAPAAMQPPPPATAPAFTMQGPGLQFTREQWNASGWSDDALIGACYMVRNASPAAPAAMQPPPPVAVTPHTAILAPAAPLTPPSAVGSAPPPAPPVPIAPAAPGYKMSDPAGTPYASYIAAGWSDAQLIQNGHMVPE